MKEWIASRMIPWFAFEKKTYNKFLLTAQYAFLYGLESQGTKLFSIYYIYILGYRSICSISCDWHAHTWICVSSCH